MCRRPSGKTEARFARCRKNGHGDYPCISRCHDRVVTAGGESLSIGGGFDRPSPIIDVRHMTFRDIIGHRRLTALIARAIDRETLPPTLLFAGPSGVGKWAVAQATAQAVNCLEPIKSAGELAIDACGKCRSC